MLIERLAPHAAHPPPADPRQLRLRRLPRGPPRKCPGLRRLPPASRLVRGEQRQLRASLRVRRHRRRPGLRGVLAGLRGHRGHRLRRHRRVRRAAQRSAAEQLDSVRARRAVLRRARGGGPHGNEIHLRRVPPRPRGRRGDVRAVQDTRADIRHVSRRVALWTDTPVLLPLDPLYVASAALVDTQRAASLHGPAHASLRALQPFAPAQASQIEVSQRLH